MKAEEVLEKVNNDVVIEIMEENGIDAVVGSWLFIERF